VIPKRHITTLAELTAEEGAAIMTELGRLSHALDAGYGTGVMQKYQPLQAENGIKVSHLHFHVFPRYEDEASLFPVPEPNSFDGFVRPSDEEVAILIQRLR
jgi:diadenosine tetraphosphate (Ap4A) HIT family hydrolase